MHAPCQSCAARRHASRIPLVFRRIQWTEDMHAWQWQWRGARAPGLGRRDPQRDTHARPSASAGRGPLRLHVAVFLRCVPPRRAHIRIACGRGLAAVLTRRDLRLVVRTWRYGWWCMVVAVGDRRDPCIYPMLSPGPTQGSGNQIMLLLGRRRFSIV